MIIKVEIIVLDGYFNQIIPVKKQNPLFAFFLKRNNYTFYEIFVNPKQEIYS